MLKSSLVIATLALGTLASSREVQAQAATIPSPFHAGQWGIEAYATMFGDGGVTRFFTPLTAVVLSVYGQHGSTKTDASSVYSPASGSSSSLGLSLGLRHHKMLAPKIASTFGGGVEAATTSQRAEYPGTPSVVNSYRSTSLGAFVEVGGQYMVADHFAIGLAYRLTGSHLSSRNGGATHGFDVETSFLPIRATLYF